MTPVDIRRKAHPSCDGAREDVGGRGQRPFGRQQHQWLQGVLGCAADSRESDRPDVGDFCAEECQWFCGSIVDNEEETESPVARTSQVDVSDH